MNPLRIIMAVAAVVALFHDVLITVGAFAIVGTIVGGYQISLSVVAAVLTIIGYSLNDTIVVFDRVREDLKLYRGRGLSYKEVLNMSMNETLSRTILTSLTTLFVVVVLFIFGGEVIRDFAFALIMLRILGPADAGVYYYAVVIFGWFDTLTNFGLNLLLTREVARDR